MSLPKYEKYKDSGVEWLGEVPAHWTVAPLRWFARCSSGDGIAVTNVESEPDIEHSVPVIGGNGIMGFTSYGNIAESVIAVGRVGALCGNIHTTRPPAWITDNALVLRSEPATFHLPFLAHALKSRNLNSIASTTAQPLITGTQLRDQRLPCPCLDEQERIATFLDHETTKIDALIAEQQRLIELLREKRQAVISHAVTKGLNPAAPMKPSGIEWLGDIPAHWTKMPLKHFSTLQRGHDLTETERTEGTYPVVTSGGVSGTHGSFMAAGPGVVTGRYGSTGRLFYIDESFWPHNTTLYVIDFHGNLPRFVWYSLQTVDFAAHSAKAAVPGIDRNDIHVLPVAVPPNEEQTAIAAFLDRYTCALDALTAEAQSAITLLQERRTALISAAVTGKIDVRSLASFPLP